MLAIFLVIAWLSLAFYVVKKVRDDADQESEERYEARLRLSRALQPPAESASKRSEVPGESTPPC